MTIEEERELFDKWYGKKPRGWFEAVRYNTAWRAWLASTNREGYRLVPLEATQEMVDAVYNSTLASDDLEGIYKAMIGACYDH